MAIVTAAAVQQNRTYVASGFVAQDYIRDDKQPVSSSLIACGLNLFGAKLVNGTATALAASNYSAAGAYRTQGQSGTSMGSQLVKSSAGVSQGNSEMDCPFRLKWNTEGDIAVSWDSDSAESTSWSQEASASTSFTERQSSNAAWSEIQITEESPFG